jgi:hypothetical protein
MEFGNRTGQHGNIKKVGRRERRHRTGEMGEEAI